jgi:hypothetical protein
VQLPQLSVPVQPSETEPQFLPEHAVPMETGVQPHMFAEPPPPHVDGAVQVPQLNVLPHPFGAVPQVCVPQTELGATGVHVTTTGSVASADASPSVLPLPLTEFPHALNVTVPASPCGGDQLTSNVTSPSVAPSALSGFGIVCVASCRPPVPRAICTCVPSTEAVVARVPAAEVARLKPPVAPLVVLMVTR